MAPRAAHGTQGVSLQKINGKECGGKWCQVGKKGRGGGGGVGRGKQWGTGVGNRVRCRWVEDEKWGTQNSGSGGRGAGSRGERRREEGGQQHGDLPSKHLYASMSLE